MSQINNLYLCDRDEHGRVELPAVEGPPALSHEDQIRIIARLTKVPAHRVEAFVQSRRLGGAP